MIKFTLFSLLLCISFFVSGCGGDSSSDSASNNLDTNMTQQYDLNLTTYSADSLTDAQKYSLAHMWNEERLAYDLYQALYKVTNVEQMKNISEQSEIVHISLVQELVQFYDINITNLVDYTENYSLAELEAMPSGVYGIDSIQNLYDSLYADGIASAAASFEVGCKVEVVDVNDLDEYIREAGTNQALIDTFTILRNGSYRHYWAFDSGLKNIGVSDGCCSLGAAYCKTEAEYPKN